MTGMLHVQPPRVDVSAVDRRGLDCFTSHVGEPVGVWNRLDSAYFFHWSPFTQLGAHSVKGGVSAVDRRVDWFRRLTSLETGTRQSTALTV